LVVRHTYDACVQPLFFIHIMKTAGTSLRNVIRAHIDSTALYPSRDYDADMHEANESIRYLLSIPDERRNRVRAYMGHFPFVVTHMLGREVTTLTTLRDPIDRAISQLKHLRVWSPEHKDLSLEAIYEDPILQPCFLRNHQAKIFAFSEADKPETYRDVLEIDDRRLAMAKANLDRVDVVGVVERYDELLRAVAARFGWAADPATRLRVGSRTDVPAALRRKIIDDNEADLDFYEYACGRLSSS
jgi:hypothetical protein